MDSLKRLTVSDYDRISDIISGEEEESFYSRPHLQNLLLMFPEGQASITVDDNLCGYILSVIVDFPDDFSELPANEVPIRENFISHHQENGNSFLIFGIHLKDYFDLLNQDLLALILRYYEKTAREKGCSRIIIFPAHSPNLYKLIRRISDLTKTIIANEDKQDNSLHISLRKYLFSELPNQLFFQSALPLSRRSLFGRSIRIAIVNYEVQNSKDTDEHIAHLLYYIRTAAIESADLVLYPRICHREQFGYDNDFASRIRSAIQEATACSDIGVVYTLPGDHSEPELVFIFENKSANLSPGGKIIVNGLTLFLQPSEMLFCHSSLKMLSSEIPDAVILSGALPENLSKNVIDSGLSTRCLEIKGQVIFCTSGASDNYYTPHIRIVEPSKKPNELDPVFIGVSRSEGLFITEIRRN